MATFVEEHVRGHLRPKEGEAADIISVRQLARIEVTYRLLSPAWMSLPLHIHCLGYCHELKLTKGHARCRQWNNRLDFDRRHLTIPKPTPLAKGFYMCHVYSFLEDVFVPLPR